jgi:hypothetical protein
MTKIKWLLATGAAMVLLAAIGFLNHSRAPVRTALRPAYWITQTDGEEAGPGSSQLQVAYQWLGLQSSGYVLTGPCGALGTSRYRFCPVASGTQDAGYIDVHLVCPDGSTSADGLTCPRI